MPFRDPMKRRTYQRDHHHRQRDVRRRSASPFCPIDGFPLVWTTDGQGRVLEHCPGCERRRAGCCMDCGRPVPPRRWRCETHRPKAIARNCGHYRARHRETLRQRARRAYRADPERREWKHQYKKQWRKDNPLKVKGAAA